MAIKESTLEDTSQVARLYHNNGYAKLAEWMPEDVLRGFIARMQIDFRRGGVDIVSSVQQGPLLRRPAIEVYGYHYPPMAMFQWGMTPAIESLIGVSLLPSYSYFRVYRKNDICRVHGDRPACEHSLSLTLANSDGFAWPLEIGSDRIDQPFARADERFAVGEGFTSVQMKPGDAVLYQGVTRHHGRVTENPNRWSAHLFMHWVERGGPFAEFAFDKQRPPEQIDFSV